MKKSMMATAVVFCILIPLTLFLGSQMSGRAYYFTSTLVILEILIPFILAFEGRKPQARELVVMAVMCALAVTARAAIPLPHFKPMFAIIIIAGFSFGAETGFLVGAVSAFAAAWKISGIFLKAESITTLDSMALASLLRWIRWRQWKSMSMKMKQWTATD